MLKTSKPRKISRDTKNRKTRCVFAYTICFILSSYFSSKPLEAKQLYIIGFNSNNILSVSFNANGEFDKTNAIETKVITNPWFMSQSNSFQNDNTFYLNQENTAELSFYKLSKDDAPLQYLGGLHLSGHPWGWGFLENYLYITSHLENKIYVYKRQSNTSFELLQSLNSNSPVGFGIVNNYLYTTSWLSNKALVYSINPETGFLTSQQEIPSCLKPRGMWTFNLATTDNPYYMGYTVCEDSNQVGIYHINIIRDISIKTEAINHKQWREVFNS